MPKVTYPSDAHVSVHEDDNEVTAEWWNDKGEYCCISLWTDEDIGRYSTHYKGTTTSKVWITETDYNDLLKELTELHHRQTERWKQLEEAEEAQ